VSARDEILARIRAASPAGEPAPVPSGPTAGTDGASDGDRAGPEGYRTDASVTGEALLDLLADRLADYRAIVRRAEPGQLGDVIAEAITVRGAHRVAVPPGADLPALPDGVEIVAADGLAPDALDALDGVVTTAAVAIAETGTIVLDASTGQGTRAVTLVPDYHLCIVRAHQVVQLVPEAVARLADHARQPLTWISGPSATSDIELNRVEGVHGPRTLEVIIVVSGP
jgi:L-lactate dehydrogenase complex protein LldG